MFKAQGVQEAFKDNYASVQVSHRQSHGNPAALSKEESMMWVMLNVPHGKVVEPLESRRNHR